MIKLNKTTNINGVCTMVVDDAEVQVAYLNATVNVDGTVSINKNIQNPQAFEANKSEVLADFQDFDQYVYNEAEKVKPE